jgi:hypothetical protein
LRSGLQLFIRHHVIAGPTISQRARRSKTSIASSRQADCCHTELVVHGGASVCSSLLRLVHPFTLSRQGMIAFASYAREPCLAMTDPGSHQRLPGLERPPPRLRTEWRLTSLATSKVFLSLSPKACPRRYAVGDCGLSGLGGGVLDMGISSNWVHPSTVHSCRRVVTAAICSAGACTVTRMVPRLTPSA